MALDTFYVDKLKGVGSVFLLTAIDTTTRWTVAKLVVGAKSAQGAGRFVDEVMRVLDGIGVELRGVLTDIQDEFAGNAFTTRWAELDNQLQGFLHRYNTKRRNHSDYMVGRIPLQVLEAHLGSDT